MLHFDTSRFIEKGFPFDIHVITIHEDFPVHTHDFAELVVILDGFASHRIDNHNYDIHPGDVYLLRGNVTHGFFNVNNLELCNIMFDPERLVLSLFDLKQIEGFHSFFVFEPYFRKNYHFRNKLRLDYSRLKNVREYINKMMEEYQQKPPGFRNRITLLINDLILYLSREYNQVSDDESSRLSKLSKVVAYMENNYLKSIKVSDLAQMAHLSERQFSRIFKESFQQTPIDFLIMLKIRYAIRLLTETDIPINQVAFNSGFSDPNYFSRIFRKKTKQTPVFCRKEAVSFASKP
jgi:AraC-like DNA-binding protein